ncbi:MAG: LPXTG cell wall anchor domain-containing protein [Clostridia bacterium]|nr:LPXTG cell wall anchor domain-containing protein [Clostridia bacterium]
MKKAISLLIAVLLMVCGIVSVSAEISPTASVVDTKITIDAIAVPEEGGTVTPSIKNPVEYIVGSDGTVTLIASSNDGFKFTHWEFITGEFDIIEGSLTSSTIVILPKGDTNIRAYAHFASEDASLPSTEPATKVPYEPDDDDKSPTTGDFTPVFFAAGAVVMMLGVAVLALKKKAC